MTTQAGETGAGKPRHAQGLIPLVIGVTGHLDPCPADLGDLEKSVRELLSRLRRDYPSTPLLLITPLAEGADRLVARVALGLDAELVVPLPLPREEYQRDFPKTVGEFAELLDHERTVHRIELPPVELSAAEQALVSGDAARDLQYALAGAYVARHSQILIALWDGSDTEKTAGTAQVVRFRRTGRFGPADVLAETLERAASPFGVSSMPFEPHDTGPVYHIVTPRDRRPSPDNPFSGRWLAPEHAPVEARSDQMPAALAKRLAHIEAFNADAVKLARGDPQAIASSERHLYQAAPADMPPGLVELRRAFGVADALALRYQWETYSFLWIIYGLAFMAVVFFEVSSHIFPSNDPSIRVGLVCYLGFLFAAGVVHRVSQQRKSQSKFQDYRAVAEGLRVLFFWRLAGLIHSAADFYLRKQRDELAWIREAIRAWGVRTEVARQSDVHSLGTGWIESQRQYFSRASRRESERLRRYRSIAAGVILAIVVLAVPTLSTNLLASPAGGFEWQEALKMGLTVVGVVLVWHLAFKGSEKARGTGAGEGPGTLVQTGVILFSALAGGALMLGTRAVAFWIKARWPLLHLEANGWVVASLGLITVIGALLHSYTEKRAFGQHARQYSRMAESFDRAGERMAALLHDGQLRRARALAVELGKEALAEHGDWVILHRERPIKLPKVEL
ncbi:MAG: hypothetical protein ACREMX_01510 [Gemmatimonadales bacterium]